MNAAQPSLEWYALKICNFPSLAHTWFGVIVTYLKNK